VSDHEPIKPPMTGKSREASERVASVYGAWLRKRHFEVTWVIRVGEVEGTGESLPAAGTLPRHVGHGSVEPDDVDAPG
jgi:hypothetical protein